VRTLTQQGLWRKLRLMQYADRCDVLQEMALQRLISPTAPLAFLYIRGVWKLHPHKTRKQIEFASIREEVAKHLRNRDHRADKFLSLALRRYRVRDPRVWDIGEKYFFHGYTHAEIAETYHISRPRATVLVHRYVEAVS
jgi:hypothetical protein